MKRTPRSTIPRMTAARIFGLPRTPCARLLPATHAHYKGFGQLELYVSLRWTHPWAWSGTSLLQDRFVCR